MKKSELIKKLQEIDGDPYVLMESDKEGYYYGGIWSVEECYSTYIDPSYRFKKTYVWDLDIDYEDAGFETEEEWQEFKANGDNRSIVLRL